MRIAPIPQLRPPPGRRRFWARGALTGDSDIRVMVLRMIATNSLAAFTSGIGGTPPVNGPERAQPVRGIAPTPGGDTGPQQRTLETVPPPPNRPTPRGSLLDLRV
ncbi:hypothetical protein GCM10011504_14640 [Siccirubricoccus deserti]|uniref:Uncharacterized protein n=1 Tax=Siccirubricoccus deserti TaxID=2013562 RepID=A0A9X0QW09_9PROT|nr:hypothetical protein [Siccirubricoccus deserti]MBC4014884.1 hypothetical protein [Siccirubricoccus deserti]GGC37331.1 hypothetical protein GCM10011504_14640 [Siccirubricoccus deserti]